MRTVILTVFLTSTALWCVAQDVVRTPRFRKQSFDKLIELDSSNIILLPIEWDNNPKFGDLKIQGNNRVQNIFFYDPTNEYQKFLFNGELQIVKSYDGHLLRRRFPRDTTKRPPNMEHIYYTVIQDDYNKDKRLDAEDPTYLYYSKFDGTGLTLLTPRFFHLKMYKYIKSQNIILATLIMDENKDKRYNSNDSEVLYKIDLNDLSRSKIITTLKLKSES